MTNTYGYISVANTKGSKEKQRNAIESEYNDIEIYLDTAAETKRGRPHLYEILAKMTAGDTLVAYSLSRIASTRDEASTIYSSFIEGGMNLVLVKEPYFNTGALHAAGIKDPEISKERYARRLILRQISEYFDLYEKDSTVKRKRLENAVKNGAQLGAPRGTRIADELEKTEELILNKGKAFGGNKRDNELIEEAGVGRSSYYKLKRKLLSRKENS